MIYTFIYLRKIIKNRCSPYIKRYKISFKYISHIKIIQKSLRINVAAVIPLENIYDHFYGVTNFGENSRIEFEWKKRIVRCVVTSDIKVYTNKGDKSDHKESRSVYNTELSNSGQVYSKNDLQVHRRDFWSETKN